MSQGNVEVVRQLFDAVASRDTATVLSLYDRDLEWDGSHRQREPQQHQQGTCIDESAQPAASRRAGCRLRP
jgi:ketosteroid isomerase-like protein